MDSGLDLNEAKTDLLGMFSRYKSGKADDVIEQFAKKVIDQRNPLDSLDWIAAQSHELRAGNLPDGLREAIGTNYFTIGFMFGWIVATRFEILDLKSKLDG
jgi:hypothetical protein